MNPMDLTASDLAARVRAGQVTPLEAAQAALPLALKAIGKANSKGVIHSNTASRYTSRIQLAVNRAAHKEA